MPPARACWGVAVQLYTLRSRGQLGHRRLRRPARRSCARCAAQGAAFVGLNPLHALFPSNPGHFSPYSPSSRHFLNVFYIAVPEVPGVRRNARQARAIVDSAGFPGASSSACARRRTSTTRAWRAPSCPCCRRCYAHFRREQLGARHARAAQAVPRLRAPSAASRCAGTRCTTRSTRTCGRRIADRYWGWPVWPEELRDPAGAGVQRVRAAARGPRSSSTRGCSGSPTSSSRPCSGSRASSACRSACTATTPSA
ncbi:MAG: 4-alpha-glucanotransferase [Rhodopseudomonas palustris]|nr:4-alpha-glucanotransferase [Rhodopseudomonas palustris]